MDRVKEVCMQSFQYNYKRLCLDCQAQPGLREEMSQSAALHLRHQCGETAPLSRHDTQNGFSQFALYAIRSTPSQSWMLQLLDG